MEFVSITPVCGVPAKSDRENCVSVLKQHIERALDIADGLELSLVGIHLDQAFHTVDDEAGN